jgi:hypothetical protein
MERDSRRMDGFQIDGRPVFARNITNADLERKDEMDDELAELRLQYRKLVGSDVRTDDGEIVHTLGEVDDCKDADERKELRARARALMADIRNRDTLLLRLYVEDENGEPFSDEALKATPFRVLTKLSQKATEYAFGVDDEEARPTTAGNASG